MRWRPRPARVPADQLSAVRRSIAQVRQYQQHIAPDRPAATPSRRAWSWAIRFTPVDSAGLYFPGGKAAYPSSLIMLAVPAMAAGVPRIVVATPPTQFGRSDLVLAACHELQLEHVYRVGGAAAIAAMAFGTATVPRVDKIVGPGNVYVQLAKREVAGAVGTDGFLGPSEILVDRRRDRRPRVHRRRPDRPSRTRPRQLLPPHHIGEAIGRAGCRPRSTGR